MIPIRNTLGLAALFIILMSACAETPILATLEIQPVSTITSSATPVEISSPQAAVKCQDTFEHRELREPYKRDVGNAPRFTLSEDELLAYFNLMGIEYLCVPTDLGAPFINVDWDSQANRAVQGRMISLGFENTYSGSGWSRIYLLHSTYDFSAGTEYDRFMKSDEWTAYKNGSLTGIERLADGRGFIRYKAGLGYDAVPVYKTYVYPGDTGYAAMVFNMGSFSGDVDAQIAHFQAGEIPESAREWMPVFDRMAGMLRIR